MKQGVNIIDFIQKTSFLTPTTKLKELSLLQHMEMNPDTTQKEMAKIIHAAPSMVNVYLNEYEKKNYIIREYISTKTVKYMITPEGLKRKKFLLITYLHELLKLYNLAEANVENFLKGLESKGYRKIILYGAGEVAAIILGILKNREDNLLETVAVIDDDRNKINKKLLGLKIIPREDIKNYKHDTVIITSYAFEDEIMEKLEKVNYPENRVQRFFSE